MAAVSAGPAMNSSSVSTESSANAPWMSSGRPRSILGYSARRSEETGGATAPVAPARSTTTAGGADEASARSVSSPIAHRTARRPSTRGPVRSTTRAMSGVPSPVPSASAPAASPAMPKLPRWSCSRRTTARPLIPIGSRASVAVASSDGMRGTPRMREYDPIPSKLLRVSSLG
jgi:hypothetical protein